MKARSAVRARAGGGRGVRVRLDLYLGEGSVGGLTLGCIAKDCGGGRASGEGGAHGCA